MPRYRRYQKDDPHTYALGFFPTIEALKYFPQGVREVLLDPRGEGSAGAAEVREQARAHGIPVAEESYLLERLAGKQNCFAAAVIEKQEPALDLTGSLLVLDQPSNMGNLGTILRTMLGFGVERLALVRPAADIWDPRVIRASMGALFRVNFSYFDNFNSLRAVWPGRVLAFTGEASTSLADVAVASGESVALVFGNEASGLAGEIVRHGEAVRIPQTEAIDSLNLAVSVGIGLHQLFGPSLTRSRP